MANGKEAMGGLCGAREGRRSALPSATRLRCRFNVCDVDCLGLLIQGSRDLYLLPGEGRGLFLVAQFVERLVRIKQDVFATPRDAGLSTHLRVVGPHLLVHRLVPAIVGTRLVHDLALEGRVLRCCETRRQQHTGTDTHYQLLHFFSSLVWTTSG